MQAGCCSKGVTFAGAAEPESEPGPCEKFLRPLPVDQTDPHQQSAVLACTCSCLQLQDQGGSPQDGVSWFTGMPVPVLCDFSHDGGGWTLLLTARSHGGWNLEPAVAGSAPRLWTTTRSCDTPTPSVTWAAESGLPTGSRRRRRRAASAGAASGWLLEATASWPRRPTRRRSSA